MTEITLTHYGVKGMRWGVRRKGRSGGKPSSDYAESRKLLRKKKLSTLSNEDIKKLNKRLEMERKFKNLDPTAKGTGKRAVDRALSTYGSAVIGGVAGAAATVTVSKILKGG
jgi:hypothetical protein